MKKSLLILLALFIFANTVTYAQSRVKDRDLRGTWELVFNIHEAAETATERVILNAVDGFLDEIEIQMVFEEDNRTRVMVNAFGEEEVEYSDWEINNKGQLLLGDTEHFQSDDDRVWMFDKGKLFAYERGRKGELEKVTEVYMKRID